MLSFTGAQVILLASAEFWLLLSHDLQRQGLSEENFC